MHRLKALIIKEFYHIIRDPSSLWIAFGLPALLLFFFGYALSLDPKEIRIGIILQDKGTEAVNIKEAFQNNILFKVHNYNDLKTALTDLQISKIKGIVNIPTDFGEKIKQRGSKATIGIITDASEPNSASRILSYAVALINKANINFNLEKGIKVIQPVNVETRFWYNQSLRSQNFLVVGAIAIIITLIGTLLTALVVAKEWEKGTMESLISTPVKIYEIVLGKIIPYFLLAVASTIMCSLIVVYIFHVPFMGSIATLSLTVLVFISCSIMIGLIISTITRNQFLASSIAIFSAFLPGFLLSGFIYEINSMPLPIQILTYIVPARYFVSCLQTIFLEGDNYHIILPNIFAMTVIACILFSILRKKTKKHLE